MKKFCFTLDFTRNITAVMEEEEKKTDEEDIRGQGEELLCYHNNASGAPDMNRDIIYWILIYIYTISLYMCNIYEKYNCIIFYRILTILNKYRFRYNGDRVSRFICQLLEGVV